MFEALYRIKNDKYSKYEVNETSYILKTKNLCPWTEKFGFFDPFLTGKNFRNQVLSPVLSPLVCGFLAVKHHYKSVMNFTSGLLRLCTGDITQGGKQLNKSLANFIATFYFVITGIVDTLRETASLITRSVTTLCVKGRELAKSSKGESSPKQGQWTRRSEPEHQSADSTAQYDEDLYSYSTSGR